MTLRMALRGSSTIAVATAALMAAPAAQGQAADQTGAASHQASATPADSTDVTPADIVVTGSYAQSLKEARDKKRDSPLVIEALSISDLNQLPDVSIADALSRLPGVAADRDPNNGDKSEISIRGMGPQLSLGTLNGRDLATSTPDRNVRYDQFPSELIGGATVYKSSMASIEEGGVAGSIDLQTVKPLDYKKNVATFDLRGVYNQLGDQFAADKRFGVRGSASFIGQFAHDTLGIAIGYAGRREPYNVLRTEHAGYDPGGYVDYNGDGVPDDATYEMSQFTRSGEDERQGVVGVVEWKPSTAVHLTLDGLYSKVKLDGTINGVIAGNINQEFANTYTNPVVYGNHLVAATVTGLPPAQTYGDDVIVQDYAAIARRNDKLFSFGGNLKFTPEGDWQATIDAAYSGVRYVADYWELRAIPVSTQNGVLAQIPQESVSYDARSEVPTFGNVNFSLTDPNINRPATLNLPFYENGRDDIYSFKGDAVYDTHLEWLPHLRIGIRYVGRTKSNLNLAYSATLPIDQRPVLSGSQIEPNALGSYDGAQAGAAPQYLAFDIQSVANQYFGGLNPYQTVASQEASWRVTENTMAGYGQLDYAVGAHLTGNIGLRVVQTDDRSSSVAQVAGGAVQPFSVKNDYFDWLPSFNLTYRATDDLQFRLGLAKTIARPAIDDLNAGFTTYLTNAYGGNPNLQPFRADQADLTAEYYFGKTGQISITGFYKDLKTYITTGQQLVTVGGTQYLFFQPINGHGGYIRGFEATFQKQLLGGLGIYTNYAFVDSDISVSRNYTDTVLGLVGLSKHNATGTLYYSGHGIDARVSYNYRSSFANVLDGGGFETVKGAGYMDAQISYAFRKGFSVVLQATNLTNTADSTFLENNPAIHGRYEEFGRTFFAGVRIQL